MQVQTVKLDQDFGTSFSGVLVSADDKLRALWASYSEQVGLSRALPALFQPYMGWESRTFVHRLRSCSGALVRTQVDLICRGCTSKKRAPLPQTAYKHGV